jgi:hypothetical protein
MRRVALLLAFLTNFAVSVEIIINSDITFGWEYVNSENITMTLAVTLYLVQD